MDTQIVMVLLALLVLATSCGPLVDVPAHAGTAELPIEAGPPSVTVSTPTMRDATAVALPTTVPTYANAPSFASRPYQGPALPTPQALDQFSMVRPAWLVVGDQVYRGTRGTSGTSDVLPSPEFLKTITKVPIPVHAQPAVVLSTTPVERLSASVERWEPKMEHYTLRTQPDPVQPQVFLLEPIPDVQNTILTVFVRFGPGRDVYYHWRLNPLEE